MRQRIVRCQFFALLVFSLLGGCTGPIGLVKNHQSKTPFILTVTTDRKCILEINGIKLTEYTYVKSLGSNIPREIPMLDSCADESNNSKRIAIGSMYPYVVNPPLAYANTKSEVSASDETAHLYFKKTMSYPVTDRWRVYPVTLNPNKGIDPNGEVQLSIQSPDWEKLNYDDSYALGFSICGYSLRAFEGMATFLGADQVASEEILFRIVGRIKRVDGGSC